MFFFSPPPPQVPDDLGDTQNGIPYQKRLEKNILVASFAEKLVSGRGEPAVVYVPWTRTEFRNLPKVFPDFLQNPDGFTKEFNLIIRTCDPGYYDLLQLIYLLVSGRKTTEFKYRVILRPMRGRFHFYLLIA